MPPLGARLRTFSLAEACAAMLLLVLLAANIYRAATQSLVHDEAFYYDRFLHDGLSAVFTRYDASNHVLHTLLARLSLAA